MSTIFQGPTSTKKSVDDFLGGEQPDEDIRSAFEKIAPLLAGGEQVEHLLLQTRASLKLFPGVLALTNRRALLLQRGIMKLSFKDLLWRNLSDAHLVESFLGAKLGFQDIHGQVMAMDALPKASARAAYAYAQSVEELALEYRRNREMEEARAAARGIPVDRFPMQPSISSAPPIMPADKDAVSPSDSLQQLKTMADQGLLTQEEYQAKKQEILSRL